MFTKTQDSYKTCLDNIFYVYVYLDPRKPGNYKYGEFEFDHEPFYIGKGNEDRLYEHLMPSRLACESYYYKTKKIKKLIRLGFNLKDGFIIKIKDNMDECDSLELEKLLIKLIGRDDLELGPLTNLTNGGEGQSGFIFSKERNLKISKSNSGRKRTPEQNERNRISHMGINLGVKRLKTTTIKIAQKRMKLNTKQQLIILEMIYNNIPQNKIMKQFNIGSSIYYRVKNKKYNNLINDSNNSLEQINNLDVSNKKYIRSSEHCLKLSQANKGKRATLETKKKMSLARIGRPTWNKGKTSEKLRKINDNQVGEILQMIKNNINSKEIIKQFNISKTLFYKIKRNKYIRR